MTNNLISYELRATAHAAENGLRRTWSPEQYIYYAAKLDRLVAAARKVIVEYPNVRSVTKLKLDAELRDIELESEAKDDT